MRTFLQSIYVKNLNSNPIEAVLFLTIGKGSLGHDRVYLQGIFANGMHELSLHDYSFRSAPPSAMPVRQKTIRGHSGGQNCFITVKVS
jgi:hypothetical protein